MRRYDNVCSSTHQSSANVHVHSWLGPGFDKCIDNHRGNWILHILAPLFILIIIPTKANSNSTPHIGSHFQNICVYCLWKQSSLQNIFEVLHLFKYLLWIIRFSVHFVAFKSSYYFNLIEIWEWKLKIMFFQFATLST